MADKMTVLYIKQTGNVVAALTHNADPTAELPPEALAAGGLLVRGFPNDEQFEVPPAQLKSANIDLDEALLLGPRGFYFDEAQKVALPVSSTTVNTVALDPTKVTVTLIAAANPGVTAKTKIWVQVSGPSLTEPRIAKGEVPIGAKKLELPIETLSPDDYFILTLAENFAPDVRSITI